MKSVFLVKSPLQLLNAIEAKYHFNLNDSECVLIVMSDKKNNAQLMSLSQVYNKWGEVYYFDSINPFFISKQQNCHDLSNSESVMQRILNSSFFSVKKINKLIKIIGDISLLFIGDNHNSFMRHFINKSKCEKIILLDDGVGAIYMADIRMNNFKTTPDVRISKKIKLAAKRIFQGLKDAQADSVCFFTVYDLNISEKDTLIKNEYRFLRKIAKDISQDDCVYFVGSPLVETGIMSKVDHFSALKQIVEYFSEKNVIYISHRRENRKNLDEISQSLNIKVCHFDYPLEFQLAMIGPRPVIVASFVSSVIENLRLIMGNDLKIVSFKFRPGTYKYQERIDATYTYYEKNLGDNFCVVPLN